MMSDGALLILIVICVILFAGDPDLHDVIVKSLMSTASCKAGAP